MFIMGAILDWKISMYIMAGITVLSTILIMIFVPESPTWLLLKNRKDEAIKSLMSLRGNEEVVNAELKAILDNLYHILDVEEKGTAIFECKVEPSTDPAIEIGKPLRALLYFLTLLFRLAV